MTEKTVFKTETLEYMGYDLKKQGTKDGKDWKLYLLKFKTGGKYPFTVTAWNKISDKGVQVKDLEDGKYYEIVYVEEPYTHPEYGPRISRKAVILKPGEQANSTAATVGRKPQPTQNQGITPEQVAVAAQMAQQMYGNQKRTPQGWVAFAAAYNEQTKDFPHKNYMHMFGVYVATQWATEFEDVLKICKKNFAEETK